MRPALAGSLAATSGCRGLSALDIAKNPSLRGRAEKLMPVRFRLNRYSYRLPIGLKYISLRLI